MGRIGMASEEQLPWEYGSRRGVWVPDGFRRSRLWLAIVAWSPIAASVVVILALGGVAGLYAAQPELDAQSKMFADASVKAIVPTWNQDELFSRSSLDFVLSRSNGFDAYFADLKTLGPGEVKNSCVGRTTINLLALPGPISAQYACEIRLNSYPAVVALGLRKGAGAWRITKFFVSVAQPAAAS